MPKPEGLLSGVAGPRHGTGKRERKLLERSATAGDSPVREAVFQPMGIPSKAGHVKPRLNPEGPPSKAKY